MLSYCFDNDSLIRVDRDTLQTGRLSHLRSLDYGATNGPERTKRGALRRQYSIPNSPSHSKNVSTPLETPRSMILIRRQSSDKLLQKRHSVDSNNSDPGYSSTNSKPLLSPSRQRSSRESSSPKSYYSSIASVVGRNSSSSSVAYLSRQSSTNSSKLPTQHESEENLQNNKWFSSSSVLLTRVKSMKEKFRRVVVQSVQPDDWPPPNILFSERYRCPSNASFQSGSSMKAASTASRAHHQLVKSKSIDPSSFPTNYASNNKAVRNVCPAGSGRNFKRERLQRSLTSYTESLDGEGGNENGIVCRDIDLKAIISSFKREEGSVSSNKYVHNISDNDPTTENGSKTPVGTSSSMGSGFGKRKLMKKQVSFDDEQGVMMINRKVSAIAEEIEGHNSLEINQVDGQRSRKNVEIEERMYNEGLQIKEDHYFTNDVDENDEENCAPNDVSHLPLLPKEVEFDEYGQTWEVYGADPDPEILGQAIQLHLERLMACRHVISIPNGEASRQKSDSILDDKDNAESPDISLRVFKPLSTDLESPENNLRFIARRLCGKWSCFSGQPKSGLNLIEAVTKDH